MFYVKHSGRRYRRKKIRSKSACCKPSLTTMSDLRESRSDRMARYKEERRRQLAAQFKESTNKINKDSTSSSSEGPRPTRASRLRAAAAATENSSPIQKIETGKELIKSPVSSITSPCDSPRARLEKDKSNKRKSNLNRSLTCEEVPLDSNDDNKNRRRRHRFFPPDVLQNNPNEFSKNDLSLTANNISPLSSPNTASTTVKIPPKKSELSIHMENARKGVTASYSDQKSKSANSRRISSSPIKRVLNVDVEANVEINGNFKQSNKENIKRKTDDSKSLSSKRDKTKVPINTNNDVFLEKRRNIRISTRMDELTALTRDTLARVERLANRNRESPKRDSDSSQSKSKINSQRSAKASSPKVDEYKSSPLKKKNETVVMDVTPSPPVSILKRKVSQEESKCAITTQTPPVTFSPNVIEPTTTNRKQGILKKRRSLDESQVLRHRSCSPDVAKSDSRSILKNQRRSSLEDIIRTPSDANIQGILKRRTSRNEDDLDNSLNSPQGILKRRSGASSAGSSSSTHHHVSIATAVILAAAEGAEIILDSTETVKPILKKKSFSEDCPNGDNSTNDLKPILKKKSSTDTDDSEDKPKRPILKSNDSNEYKHYQSANESGSECEVKPILKSTTNREEVIRPRLSFCGDDEQNIEDMSRNHRRRSQTITGFEFSTNGTKMRMPDRDLTRPRVISVAELVMGFEKCTGAIPKRPSSKRNSDRYMTQPITFTELEASLNFVRSPQREEFARLSLSSPIENNHSVQSLLDLTSSIENDSRLNSFLSNSIPNTSSHSGKMSSDSAFQSLGDGLELEQDEMPPPSPKRNVKLEQGKLELQMKAIAEEAAKKMKSSRVNSGIQKYRNRTSGSNERASSSRFSTQPITLDEVQEAAKINHEDVTADQNNESEETDPSKLSLSERIKLFSKKQAEEKSEKLDIPRRRTRFNTQPITYDEVETARVINTEHNSTLSPLFLDEETVSDRRGILKQKLEFPVTPIRASSKSPPPKSAMKNRSPDFAKPRSILKYESATDFTYDEGISSNDSESDSEVKIVVSSAEKVSDKSGNKFSSKSGSDQTSDESSGGREIQSIIGREALLKRKQLRSISNGNIQKSKSQAGVVEVDPRPLPKGVQRSMTTDAMQRNICQLREQLKQNGDSEWRKRISKLNTANEELNLLNVKKNLYNDELSEKASNLKAKKDELDASSKQWKNRVEKTDAVNYSVAGRMQIKDVASVPINITNPDKIRRTPKAKRFKGKEGDDKETSSSPASPNIDNGLGFRRSISVPTSNTDDSSGSDTSLRSSGRKVTVMRPDDDTYQSFFESVKVMKSEEIVDVSLDDFDSVTRNSESLLVQKKNVRVQKRRGASKNPLKTLAARSDIKNEYTEITTGIAQRETKRLNIEKLGKNSHLALEALAGLASKEDFAAVALKKSSAPNSSYLAYKNLMLLQIKGRRHVQIRLVEPVAASINQGDNYILVTPDALFNYVGAYSNVIEQSRAADIVNHIQSTKDLGCKVEKPIVIKSKSYTPPKDLEKFWGLLGADASVQVVDAGHPDEDEVYESTIVDTNMIYYVENDALVPLEEYWGSIPKIEMLKPSAVLVFDFGSEMYVWTGKNANVDEKRTALRLAKELWENGYNYSDCSICPLNVSKILGARDKEDTSLISDKRPDWALFAKVSQHGETILFREKFLDWPDYSRVIKVREEKSSEKTCDIGLEIKPCDANALLKSEFKEPDFEMEGSHLGRGRHYYDTETNKHCEIKTLDVTSWIILENTYEKLDEASIGHFYDGDSYIIKWDFRVTVTGRELSGKPSKHLQVGRDRCIYFYWLGKNSSVNEKGAAAILTVELDSENAKQIRVPQGSEHPMFLQLFNGKMFIHSGKRDGEKNDQRLYICRGEIEHETVFIEVPCSMRSLRSRTSFLLIESDKVTIWNGAKSLGQTKDVANLMAEYITTKTPAEFKLDKKVKLKVYEEGKEASEFLECLGEKRQLYNSLVKSPESYEKTLRMFMFNSISGKFEATEVLCHHRSLYTTPYPFLQSDLYSTNQPAIFLLDNCHELWLWQGWWPERESDQELSEQTGSGAIRWQAERKAAMQTAVDYWKIQHPDDKSVPAYLVWAGLEPLSFTNLFPIWCDRDDIAELNIKEGKKAGEIVLLEKELALLTRTTYPLAELLQRPLPEGVDPTHLEIYLSSEDFHSLLSMSKEEFQKLPIWKQTALKKDKGLF